MTLELGQKDEEHPFGYGFCQCGCGKPTPTLYNGQHARYVNSLHHPKTCAQRNKERLEREEKNLIRVKGRAIGKTIANQFEAAGSVRTPKPHQPPERLKHVFDFFEVESRFTPERVAWLADGSGFVYVIQCEGLTKIGVAADPQGRMAFLQVGNPYELRLLKSFPSQTPLLDEERLQDRFGRFHVRGEWYRLPNRILKRLISLNDLSTIHDRAARIRNREKVTENQEGNKTVQHAGAGDGSTRT